MLVVVIRMSTSHESELRKGHNGREGNLGSKKSTTKKQVGTRNFLDSVAYLHSIMKYSN